MTLLTSILAEGARDCALSVVVAASTQNHISNPIVKTVTCATIFVLLVSFFIILVLTLNHISKFGMVILALRIKVKRCYPSEYYYSDFKRKNCFGLSVFVENGLFASSKSIQWPSSESVYCRIP